MTLFIPSLINYSVLRASVLLFCLAQMWTILNINVAPFYPEEKQPCTHALLLEDLFDSESDNFNVWISSLSVWLDCD